MSNTILKLLNIEQKQGLIKRLTNLVGQYGNDNNREMWLHSQRMLYSLKHELVPQQVYTDKYPDFSLIISKYTNKNAGRNIEIFTLGPNDEATNQMASDAAVGLINNPKYSYCQVQSSPYYLYKYLMKAVKDNGIYIIDDIGANCMTFPKSKYKDLISGIKPVKGFYCAPMRAEHANVVNNRFKYARHPDTLKWIIKTITDLPQMGCYNDKGDLVGQFITMESGNVGGLYVIDECKGLKLGKWIVQELTKHMMNLNYPIVLETEFPNIVSYNLFTNLGFETIAHSYYMLFSRSPEVTDEI